MSAGSGDRTFISYSRNDGVRAARCLRWWLGKHRLSIWQDIVALEGGRDWWSQIEDALKSKPLQHFILVVTPSALASPHVRREIRLARQEGKAVCPVKGPGLADLNALPRWLGEVYDLRVPERRTNLLRVLEADSRQNRVPMMAPEPPPDFVARPKEFGALKQQLLDAKGDAVAGITAALKGAGGYGKTTLAKALAHDPDIQDAYFDGVLWAELGEKPETRRLIDTLSDLVAMLSGEPPEVETIHAAAAKLAEALSDRRILLVVDDVWRKPDLEPFLQGGRHCVRLVTTRIDGVLPAAAARETVDAMQGAEALSLLAGGLPADQAMRERAGLQILAARLGEWPLLMKIVNGFLRDRVGASEPLPIAIAGANERLDDEGLTVFDPTDEGDRANAVARTIGVSLDLLSASDRERFGELGVFPEDADIPIGVVTELWASNGGLKRYKSEDLLSRLFNLSLLLERDLDQRVVRLHDTVRHFLRDKAGRERLAAQHKALAAILEGASESQDERTRRYLYRSLPHHLAEAGERQKLDALLLDPGWLKAKLEATGNPAGLILEYQQYGEGDAQSLIGRTLRLISGILARDRRQLPVQLAERLNGIETVGLPGFVAKARKLIPRPTIVPLRPSLAPPGAETARLEGHADSVNALCSLPDGRFASGSSDNTIRLWDVASGTERPLEGHRGRVDALCLLPDGRLASGSADKTIRLWDVASGTETARLKGHTNGVQALCLVPDGRLASGSWDNTIRLWDVASLAETARLKGHTSEIRALCQLADGRLASGSSDNTIRLWDVASGEETVRLDGHRSAIQSLCQLPDGRLASGSSDNTIRLWDVASGKETARLDGHRSAVQSLCLLPEGLLASGSYDKMIRLWDAASGTETAYLEGHTHAVQSLCLLPDGRLASGSYDNTIRLWDVASATGPARLNGHTFSVTALCLLPDGRVSSGSPDTTIRLWDAASGRETGRRLGGHTGEVLALCLLPGGRLASGLGDYTICLWDLAGEGETTLLKGHMGAVQALCLLPDGRLASGSGDYTIRMWDVASGGETTRLKGHMGAVLTLCMLPDGRLASGSGDNTIRLWDVASRTETARLEGHRAPVRALCPLPDGRLASGSRDNTIRLWDAAGRAETARLEGHRSSVRGLCPLPDGRLASGSRDSTIRLWDVVSGAESARLEIDAPVTALIAIAPNRLVAGDSAGRLHWLEIPD